jgi:hypothetical protein
MTKYTLIAEHTDLYTGKTLTKNTTEFEVDGLMDVIENVEMFLKGTGFVFDGYLDIVPPEEDDIDTQEWHNPEWKTPQEDSSPLIDEWTQVRREDAMAEGGSYFTGATPTVTVNGGTDTITLSDMNSVHSKYYFDTERNK